MWKLTENLIDANEETCHLFQSDQFDQTLFDTKPQTKFRMRDDDDEVYFVGLILTEDIEGDETMAFAPMDDLGIAYGCTVMQYMKGNKWETL